MLILVGTIIAFFSDEGQIPRHQGWLLCNGEQFDETEYPALQSLLKSNRTPDLRGYFLRGLDRRGVNDPEGANRAIGQRQECSIEKHSHKFAHYGWADSGALYKGGTNSALQESSTAMTGGSETRPLNIAVNYLIYAGDSEKT